MMIETEDTKMAENEKDAQALLTNAPRWVKEAYERSKAGEARSRCSGQDVTKRIICNRIQQALHEQAKTYAALAAAARVSPAVIIEAVNHPELCRDDVLQAMIDALKIDVSDITGKFPL